MQQLQNIYWNLCLSLAVWIEMYRCSEDTLVFHRCKCGQIFEASKWMQDKYMQRWMRHTSLEREGEKSLQHQRPASISDSREKLFWSKRLPMICGAKIACEEKQRRVFERNLVNSWRQSCHLWRSKAWRTLIGCCVSSLCWSPRGHESPTCPEPRMKAAPF